MSTYVTKALGEALLELMNEKNIEKITIDELVEKAQIGRATYFRNFKSKDDVLAYYIAWKWHEYEKVHRLKKHKIDDPFRVQRYFEFCYSMKDANNLIIAQEHSYVIMHAYEIIFHNNSSDLDDNFEKTYMLYGLYGILISWAKNGYIQTPEQMSNIVISRIFSQYITEIE